MDFAIKKDVVVIGAGNAALTAALSAIETGASVLIIEKAPFHLRGGNSFFSGGLFRFSYNNLSDVHSLFDSFSENEKKKIDIGTYPDSKYYSDIMRVTEGLSDPTLARTLVTQSYPTMLWMKEKGIKWILSYGRQSFLENNKHKFWGGLIVESVGGGKGLCDFEFNAVEKANAEIAYDTKVIEILRGDSGSILGLKIRNKEGVKNIKSNSVILASGGFEANPQMRASYLGPSWELAKVRGTRFNTGDGMKLALDIGAQPYGNWSGCHAVAWDLNAPLFGDRVIADLYQKHSYQLGIIVNIDGKRFVDEGADFRNYTYVKYGREILSQPHRVVFQLFDSKTRDLLRDEYFIPQASVETSNNLDDLANKLGISESNLLNTIEEYNSSIPSISNKFNPSILDGRSTNGIYPPKSNWALPLDTPPYFGYAVTCGITFTFGGLRINTSSQVIDTEDKVIEGLYAAGEVVGGLFYNNYPGGSGLMAGSVFGKIAGYNSAKYSLNE